jgi:hypothetical protein
VLQHHFSAPVVLANIGDPENWQLAKSTPIPPERTGMDWLTDRLVVLSSGGKFVASSAPIAREHTANAVDLQSLLSFLLPSVLEAAERRHRT